MKTQTGRGFVKAALVGMLAIAIAPVVLETGEREAHAWPQVNLPSAPTPPAPPLPAYSIDRADFPAHPGTTLSRAAAPDCYENHDWFVIRGSNVSLSTSVTMEGDGLYWVLQRNQGQCFGLNCIQMYVSAMPGTNLGRRTFHLKAVDGRELVASFDVVQPNGRCDTANSHSSGGSYTPGRSVPTSTVPTGTPPGPPPPVVVQTMVDSRSKTCQGNALTMSPSQTFTTRTTQNVTVSVSFNRNATCWCPSTPFGCDTPAQNSRTWILRRADGFAISIAWAQGDTVVPNLPAGTYTIELNEGAVPPGSYSVTYTP